MDLPSILKLYANIIDNCSNINTVTLGGPGKPISDTSNFSSGALYNNNAFNLIIYVSDPSNPPTLTGRPWSASSATIIYEQA